MKKQTHLVIIVILLSLALVGCAILPGPSATGEIGITELPTMEASATPLPPSPEASQVASCGTANPDLQLPSASYQDYPAVIRDFLNQGGTPEQLDQGLYQAMMLGQPLGIVSGDFTGNSEPDVAVVLINPESAVITPDGMLLVYICQDGQYQQYSIQPPPGATQQSPIIKYVQDMDADQKDELIAGFADCGAHTCFESLGVYSWLGDGFQNRLQGDTGALPYPDVTLNGPDQDGYYALSINSIGYGSVGAGPQRSLIQVYTFKPADGMWELFAEKLGSSKYRIHALHDADNLAKQEKFRESLVLYQQVISSTELQDWMDPITERAVLAAYARFKMFAIYTMLGQEELAAATLDSFDTNVPDDSPQAGYLLLARLFKQTGGGQNPTDACSAVQEAAANNADQILAPLGSQVFGYANRDYLPEDICPW
jgi:hypothetical protein